MTSEISSSTRFLHAIEMGLGAWEWGDRIMWQYGRTHTEEDIRAAFQVSVQEGIRFIDTAEVYGSGRSERLLGEFVRETQQTVLIATKFFPMPWRLSKDSVPRALRRSLERLGVETYVATDDGTLGAVEAVGQSADILMDQFSLFSVMGRPEPSISSGGGGGATSVAGMLMPPDRYNTPIEDLSLSATSGRKTLLFPTNALYVVLE